VILLIASLFATAFITLLPGLRKHRSQQNDEDAGERAVLEHCLIVVDHA
jgi:hypothetical protein